MWTEAVRHFGDSGVLLSMTLESAGIPVPSEVVLPLAGYLVSQGSLAFWPVALMAILGQLLGSVLLFFVGSVGGAPLGIELTLVRACNPGPCSGLVVVG